MLILSMLLQVPPAKDCYSAGGDQEIAQCWDEAASNADKELNRIWPDVLRTAREADKAFTPNQRRGEAAASVDLLNAQRAWVKFRDAECVVESDYAQGGSLQPIIEGECATNLTRERIKKLQSLAEDFRGH